MKYAYVRNNVAVEVVQTDPAMLFVPNYASQFITVPDNVEPGWETVNGQWQSPSLPAADRNAMIVDIDRQADALRLAIVGDPVRVEEYRLARDEAKAYIGAGYSGPVPPSVMSWAKAKAWSARQAADDIAAVAAAWESALYAVRSVRLQGKESVRNAATDAAAKAAYDAILAQLAALHP